MAAESGPFRPILAKAAAAAALALVALLLLKALAFHRLLIGFPYPLDSHEPAEAILAQGVAAGLSTGDPANLPMYSNHYGPVYSLVTGALCRHGFACDAQSQRLLAALFLAGILALAAAACRKAGAGWVATAAIGVWTYELLLLSVTPSARPDALGTLLFFAGLSLPFLLDYGAASLALAAALFALAAATKLYFLAGPLYLALGLLATRRLRALGVFAACMVLAASAVGAWLLHSYPYDFAVTAMRQTNNLNFAWGHLRFQLWAILVEASPCAVALGLAAAYGWLRRKEDAVGGEWGVYAAAGGALFLAVMGGATGARYTYLVQLALLPLAVWTASAFRTLRLWGWLLLALVLVDGVRTAPVTEHEGFDPKGPVQANWALATGALARARCPVVVSALTPAVQARGLAVYDTGLSDFNFDGRDDPAEWRALLFPHRDLLALRAAVWDRRIRDALADPRTDLVVVDGTGFLGARDLLQARYLRRASLTLLYPQIDGSDELEFYTPKPVRPPGPAQR